MFFVNFMIFCAHTVVAFFTPVCGGAGVRHCKCLYDKGLQKAVFRTLKDGLLDGKT